MISDQQKKKSSHRRQVALGCAGGAAGLWLSFSNQYVPRILREIIADSGRVVLNPRYTPDPALWDDNALTASWLGHSTVLLNFYGLHILTDPVLFRRVGADLGIGTVGPKRLVAPALTLRQLPHIDLVLLSHAHMDHFDLATIRRLPGTTKAVTARNTADLFTDTRIKHPKELAWGQSTVVHTRNGDVTVRAFEVSHWGARWRHDRYRGYNGYTLERGGKKIIFGGDTAMCDSFRGLRCRKAYELAIMPIGAYQPWVRSHCTPEQAIMMANQAGAERVLPIHHKTFKLGQEGPHEPLERFEAALEKERVALREIGETVVVA